jgi:hypothetical protein
MPVMRLVNSSFELFRDLYDSVIGEMEDIRFRE